MFWIIAAVLIPIIVVMLLFFSMADDFWQLVTLKLDFSRFFGDLFHVFLIILIALLAEAFVLFHIVTMLL